MANGAVKNPTEDSLPSNLKSNGRSVVTVAANTGDAISKTVTSELTVKPRTPIQDLGPAQYAVRFIFALSRPTYEDMSNVGSERRLRTPSLRINRYGAVTAKVPKTTSSFAPYPTIWRLPPALPIPPAPK